MSGQMAYDDNVYDRVIKLTGGDRNGKDIIRQYLRSFKRAAGEI